MSNTPIIAFFLCLAIFILFLVSHSPIKSPNHRNRRIKLRSSSSSFSPNLSHEPIPFDPLVADIERRREDKQWEKQFLDLPHLEPSEHQPEWEDFMDAEDYLNDEDMFNVTHRLVLLFPRVDVNPSDGFVTEVELTDWNLQQTEREALHRTKRELELHDKNHDGLVSSAEYQPQGWVHHSDDMGWWKAEHFNASDADGDGLLNITEFNDFLHPADTENPKLLHWLCKEEVRERDTDKDDKLNFKEFFHGLFDLVQSYDGDYHNSSLHSEELMQVSAEELFAQLDQDGDGYLADVELLPIIGKLHPSERYYAKQQAHYIISQADTDKDERLSMREMIENPYVFYSSIFDDDEDDDDYEYHEELR